MGTTFVVHNLVTLSLTSLLNIGSFPRCCWHRASPSTLSTKT